MDLQSIIENYGYAAILIGKLKSYEIYIMGSVAIVGVLIWVFHFYRRRRRRAEFIAESR